MRQLVCFFLLLRYQVKDRMGVGCPKKDKTLRCLEYIFIFSPIRSYMLSLHNQPWHLTEKCTLNFYVKITHILQVLVQNT